MNLRIYYPFNKDWSNLGYSKVTLTADNGGGIVETDPFRSLKGPATLIDPNVQLMATTKIQIKIKIISEGDLLKVVSSKNNYVLISYSNSTKKITLNVNGNKITSNITINLNEQLEYFLNINSNKTYLEVLGDKLNVNCSFYDESNTNETLNKIHFYNNCYYNDFLVYNSYAFIETNYPVPFISLPLNKQSDLNYKIWDISGNKMNGVIKTVPVSYASLGRYWLAMNLGNGNYIKICRQDEIFKPKTIVKISFYRPYKSEVPVNLDSNGVAVDETIYGSATFSIYLNQRTSQLQLGIYDSGPNHKGTIKLYNINYNQPYNFYFLYDYNGRMKFYIDKTLFHECNTNWLSLNTSDIFYLNGRGNNGTLESGQMYLYDFRVYHGEKESLISDYLDNKLI